MRSVHTIRTPGCPKSSAFAYTILVLLVVYLLMEVLNPLKQTNLRSSITESGEDDAGDHNPYSEKRAKLYEDLATELNKQGAQFVTSGMTSQSLRLSEIFSIKDGRVHPILKPADPAVRAFVLYLKPDFSLPIWKIVQKVFMPYFSGAIWFQDAYFYHFSMYHASHNVEPVIATADEVEAEKRAVKKLASRFCPLSIYLERIVLTSTGVLLACWQVVSGTDPVIIRNELRKALPRSPNKQLYNPVMLHTSLARILDGPNNFKASANGSANLVPFLKELVSQVNDELRHFEAIVDEIWFVEELDVLALALNGRIRAQKFDFRCMSV